MEKQQIKVGKTALTGVIDIGSGFMQLKIACQKEDQTISILESVTKTLAIGKETFSEGRISPEMMRELSKNLLGFKQLLREYKVRKVRVVATGAIREATNREYVIDQIRANTGFSIEIINGPEERLLTQYAIQKALPNFDKMKKDGLLIVNIGSGGVQVTAYAAAGLRYGQNINMGALRIRRILSSLETKTVEYTKILEEYTSHHIQEVIQPMKEKFNHLVMTGEEVDSIYRICSMETEDNIRVIDPKTLKKLYDQLMFMNTQQIADAYSLSFERAEMLLPTIMIMHAFEKVSNAKKICCPSVGLSNGILFEMNRDKEDTILEKETLRYIRFVASQYHNPESHIEAVVQYALLIFDHLKRKQNLTKRHRLILEAGARLHDLGKGISLVNHAQCGAALVSHMDLMGISEEEQKQLAILIRYHEGGEPKAYDEQYKSLSRKSRIAVSKLLAILQLANAMDCSYKQKIYDLSVKQENDSLVLRGFAKENAMLEEWIFHQKSELFREVFSLEPKLKLRINRTM